MKMENTLPCRKPLRADFHDYSGGDYFVTKDIMPTGLEKDFENPVAIDMESAAVGQCCHIAKVPYGILRTISDDTAGDDNALQYEDNLGEACRKAVLLAIEIIKLRVSK